MRTIAFSIISILGALLLSVQPIFAQSQSIELSISAIPTNPKPLEQVQLTVSSFSTDLNRSSITWTLNGRLIESGTGKTRVTVTAPATGGTAQIGVTSSNGGTQSGSGTFTLQPGNIDMLWESVDGYVPPFYKGKALPIVNSTIRVSAIPTANSPKQQSYTWTRNDIAQQSSSGYNRSSYTYTNNELQRADTVRVTSGSGFFSGTNSVTITPRTPSLVAYQKHEGFIDYANGATSTLSLTGPGSVLKFEPYYFSTPQTIDQNLNIQMTIDDEDLGTLIPPNELRLSRPENGGVSSLQISIIPTVYSLQNLARTFRLIFN